MDILKKTTHLEPPEEFSFPYSPYSIQKDFMNNLYRVLEEGKLGIFESPTGTGKSLSIICGVLRWLCDHEVRNKSDLMESIVLMEKELKKYNTDSNDDWLMTQSKKSFIIKSKNEFQLQLKVIAENEDQINAIKKKLENKSIDFETSQVHKLSFPLNVSNVHQEKKYIDDNILLEDTITSEEDHSDSDEELENKFENIKIYFCSRTHSQLSQFIREIQKSPYSDVRVVPLASRQTFCINPEIKKLKSSALINERCLELHKNKSAKATKTGSSQQIIKKKKCNSSCSFNNKNSVNSLKEKIIGKIQDIEELILKGQQISACPYYAARAAVPLAQLIVIPYNTLLHKSTRDASKIQLKNNVVIIDEAHNLLDAIENIHSTHVTGNQLCACYNQLNQYKEKYEKLFSANNLLCLNQLLFVIAQFISVIGGNADCSPIESSRGGTDTKIYTLAEFVHAAEIDNYNLYKLVNFCYRSKISLKLQGFIEKYPSSFLLTNKINENGLKTFLKNISTNENTRTSKNSTKKVLNELASSTIELTSNPMLSVTTFLESLTNHCEDGRIICARQTTVGQGSLKFLLLNPAAHFQDIIKDVRSVIVAGGTMQPISEFEEQLFKNAGADVSRIMTFSYGHVVPSENILPIVLCSGPSGKQLDYSYQNRNTLSLMNELGRVLDNVCNVVPAGIVCFFPSYEFELTIFQHFEKSGLIEKLSNKKKIFREPKKSSDVDRVLAEFAQQIADCKKFRDIKLNGCLLFSVMGGKLSEGLNFSDDLGRCVIVVGLPYPNIRSLELQEKMNYLNKSMGPGSGNQYYENLCMKSVNQSIGRAVRHKNDYAAVLLLDHRYARENVQNALPAWMSTSLIMCEKFGPAFGTLTKFFKSKS